VRNPKEMNHRGTETQRRERQREERKRFAKEARRAGIQKSDPSSFVVSWLP
jgi:hypothetical protein